MPTENDNLLDLIERHKNVVSIIHEVSSKVNSSLDLDTIFSSAFNLLDLYFNFKHIMILLVDTEDESVQTFLFCALLDLAPHRCYTRGPFPT